MERVVAHRSGLPTEDKLNPGAEYFCKCVCLPYSECTWERVEFISDEESFVLKFSEIEN